MPLEAYYLDIGSSAVLLMAGHSLISVDFFDGVLYWTKYDSPKGIAIMTNYESTTERTWNVTEVASCDTPAPILIVETY